MLIIVPLIPINFSFVTTTDTNELLVRDQECGCPCPDVSIIKGTLEIPDSLKHKIKPGFSEANLTGDTPYTSTSELLYYDFKIKGYMVGATTDLCSPSECYYVPTIFVESYSIGEYIPLFIKWNPIFLLIYLVFVLISLGTLISLTIVSSVKKSA